MESKIERRLADEVAKVDALIAGMTPERKEYYRTRSIPHQSLNAIVALRGTIATYHGALEPFALMASGQGMVTMGRDYADVRLTPEQFTLLVELATREGGAHGEPIPPAGAM